MQKVEFVFFWGAPGEVPQWLFGHTTQLFFSCLCSYSSISASRWDQEKWEDELSRRIGLAFDHSARDEGSSPGSLMSKICLLEKAGSSSCSKLAPTPRWGEEKKKTHNDSNSFMKANKSTNKINPYSMPWVIVLVKVPRISGFGIVALYQNFFL